MGDQPHPFHAVAEMAAKRGLKDLKIKVERGGAYVRLYQNTPPLFFKHRKDPSDSFDRKSFNDFKRGRLRRGPRGHRCLNQITA